jgi:hypothetical protein
MANEKSLVEEAIIQMKNLEEAVAENAKGILASTMSQEIKELVKESLTEQDDEIETDIDVEDLEDTDETDDESDDMMGDDTDMDNMDMDFGDETDDEEDIIDLTDADDEEVLRVFQLMGPEDNIVVTKDESGNTHLKDEETGKEYMIVGESEEEYEDMDMEMSEEDDMDMEMSEEDDMDMEMYEEDDMDIEMSEEDDMGGESIESIVERMFGSDDEDEFMDFEDEEMEDEIVYEIEMDDEEIDESRYGSFGNLRRKDFRGDEYVRDNDTFANDEELFGIGDDDMYDTEEFDDFESYNERYPMDKEDSPRWFKGSSGKKMFDSYREKTGKPFKVKTKRGEMDEEEDINDESIMESKSTIKPKGVGMGKPKFSYDSKPNQGEGFKTKMKQGPRTMGTGKAKFDYKDGENAGSKLGKNKVVKKVESKESSIKKPMVKKAETKEASRTLGNGSYFRKGGLPKPRAHSKFNANIKENTTNTELKVLREKNEEYRKALNIFRNKLNEVAVFNSNLAYATRLFTEHSTSKQEKINILRRFDSVETIKESKNLYQTIKNELSEVGTKTQTVNESLERKIAKAPSTGSAVNLIESKTYENPQFLRMKDLMAKIK